MKLSAAIIAASLASASAFTAPATASQKASFVGLRMAEDSNADEIAPFVAATEAKVEQVAPPAAPAAPTLPQMSQSLPFMERPPMLDGSMVGDVGFDPLGFAKTKEDLMNYREAEIKHARLAMLAAAGWPVSELFDKKIASALNLAPLVDASDRAPSVLNGGLGKVSPVYWAVCLIAAGAIDLYGINRAKSNAPDYFPGNLGFDPLGLYPKDKAGQERMQLQELKNGRLAMIAITAFAFQEFATKLGVVSETPLFFKPLGTVLHEYTNSGYIYH
jgi:hypothetical protein